MNSATTLNLTSPSLTVAELVRAQPAAVRILQRYQIDFCCGGKKPLQQACAEVGVVTADLLAEVAAASHVVTLNWTSLPPRALCDTIEHRFHAPLADELPRLQAMAQRVLLVHGAKDPERLEGLAETVDALIAELVPHLREEEAQLFPLIRDGQRAQAAALVAQLEAAHETVGGLLKQLRHLTDGFVPPLGACGTWRALYQGLGELEAETHEHVHVENNVLFATLTDA